ncbi:hypothetical protein V6N12_040468 [Hibiscus sabdariffa]|uniref:dihydrofolate reductase n=2 Tax=Hibiscus sabdariffa TaxID=183260 RepID=A0ABR2E4C3_9ROSI
MSLQNNVLLSKVLLGCYANGFSNLISGSQILRGFTETAKLGFSTMSGDNLRSPQRNYQVVVAATREMGIGKDGKLPWRLPSDLKFFKELTVTTSDPEKMNVVVMGRKTWESIPFQNRPLPGRLNVVLTRSHSSDITTGENVVICGSIPSALELLAEFPYCFSTEKVFVIGGGQIFRETLNAPGCEAIHITEIETRFECDAFIPSIDLSCFQPWYSSKPLVENDVRFSFATYVRVRSGATGYPLNTKAKSNGSSNCNNVDGKDFTFLPRMILERRDELTRNKLKLVHEIIWSGNHDSDRLDTKFNCHLPRVQSLKCESPVSEWAVADGTHPEMGTAPVVGLGAITITSKELDPTAQYLLSIEDILCLLNPTES